MKKLAIDTLKLKAAIEFGSEHIYSIKNGGLGPTLCVLAESREKAREARIKIPSSWEGLYVLVLHNGETDEDLLYDPNLS